MRQARGDRLGDHCPLGIVEGPFAGGEESDGPDANVGVG
jgi:hypothetical protein